MDKVSRINGIINFITGTLQEKTYYSIYCITNNKWSIVERDFDYLSDKIRYEYGNYFARLFNTVNNHEFIDLIIKHGLLDELENFLISIQQEHEKMHNESLAIVEMIDKISYVDFNYIRNTILNGLRIPNKDANI